MAIDTRLLALLALVVSTQGFLRASFTFPKRGQAIPLTDDAHASNRRSATDSHAAAASSSYPHNPPMNSDASPPIADPRAVARAVLPSVALVTPVGVRNSTMRGSGFVVDFPPASSAAADDDDNNDDEDVAQTQRGATGLHLHLLTAAHVAAPGHRLYVSFNRPGAIAGEEGEDSGKVEAEIVGRSDEADLALLRVALPLSETEPVVPALRLSDTSPVEVGTPAFAIGYPAGGVQGSAMTSGIVCANARGLGYSFPATSEKERAPSSANEGENEGGYSDKIGDRIEGKSAHPPFYRTSFVVTDAAMAGGMSGGPLVDSSGTVLGVNALVRPDLRALGNYAVDAAECRAFLSDLAKTDRQGGQVVARTESKKISDSSCSGGTRYRVLLYNDRHNKRERVSRILRDAAGLDTSTADEVMMMAHKTGRGIVREFFSPIQLEGMDRTKNDDSLSALEAACNLRDKLRDHDILVEIERVR